MASATPAPAWQPLTFGGVASFARAPFRRLLLLQLVVALLVALSVVWAAHSCWFPVIEAALSELPEKGIIQGGQLQWTRASPLRLAEGPFLAILVDLEGTSGTDQSADVQLEFGKTGVRVRSLLGYAEFPYPKGRPISLNRAEILAWCGAWRPFLLGGIAVAIVAFLFAGWLVHGLFFSIPVRSIAFYSDRSASWIACLRLACAALLPGAVMMSGAILLYSVHRLNLVGLLFAWLLHLVIGCIYAGFAPLCLARLENVPRRRANPFALRKAKRR